ncbi:orotidine-5'-phosphate decarboxylase [Tepidamorphus sp. 3E244]|uniref:orotidine-5'-phosphate decarboxylase n=1 Tax=Tepidamorphus sp. 3E244 TaxID=3385498 RepID=UPI0038FC57DB
MAKPSLSARDRLIVALDVPDTRAAETLARSLDGHVGVFKLGLELAMNGGIDLARDLAADGKPVFLDLKLLDISNTVTKAVENAAGQGFAFLTIHAYPAAMRAAVAGIGDSALCLLGVTVLTSLNAEDLAEAGYSASPDELVLSRAQSAASTGMGGIVCSPMEVAAVRAKCPDLNIVTPGVRPAGSDTGDQKRIATPASAIKSGSDYLVVGRPITQAGNPAEAADTIVDEIASAF